MNNLGCVFQDQGDLDRAAALFEEALPLFRASGEVQGLGGQLGGLGDVAVARGEYGRARALYEECLEVARRANFKQRMAYVHQGLGRLAVINGGAGAAIAHYRQALTILRETGDREAIAMSFEGLATVPISSEQPDSAPPAQHAVRLLGAATALRLALGSPPPPADRIAHERALTAIRATLGEAAFAAAWAEGEAMTLEQAIDHALGATGPT
jgi:tetratricopeptide (TPR) repeat protein